MRVEGARALVVSPKPCVNFILMLIKGLFFSFLFFSNCFLINKLNHAGIQGSFQGSVFWWWFILFFLFFLSFYSRRWFFICQIFLLIFLSYLFYLSSIAECSVFFDHLDFQFKKLIWSKEELSIIYDRKVAFHFGEFKGNFFRLEEKARLIGNSKNPEELHFAMEERYVDFKYIRQVRQLDYFSLFVLSLTGLSLVSYTMNYFLVSWTYCSLIYSGQMFTDLTYHDFFIQLSLASFHLLYPYF